MAANIGCAILAWVIVHGRSLFPGRSGLFMLTDADVAELRSAVLTTIAKRPTVEGDATYTFHGGPLDGIMQPLPPEQTSPSGFIGYCHVCHDGPRSALYRPRVGGVLAFHGIESGPQFGERSAE